MLKITIPDGYELDTVTADNSTIVLREKQPAKKANVTDIKTVADLFAYNGLTHKQFDDSCTGLSGDEIAYRIIKLLVQTLNEGWTPDWSNENQWKYYPWFDMAGSSGFRFDGCAYWGSGSTVGSRLCFKSRELAEHAGKHFTSVYKQFMSY